MAPSGEQSSSAGAPYAAPCLSPLGSLADLTLGHGGSSLDGHSRATQRGRGNDGRGPHRHH